jgi:hypothetical protein
MIEAAANELYEGTPGPLSISDIHQGIICHSGDFEGKTLVEVFNDVEYDC